MNKKLFIYFILFLSSITGLSLHAQIITTVAGDSVQGYNGDNIPATTAKLYGPYSTAIDASGNLYIADLDNNRVRKVNAVGIITTIAGTGIAGYSGDDSSATNAKLNGPVDVATDAEGNVYISDNYNHRIRKVNTSGIITTIVGTGSYGYNGDGIVATAAQIYSPHGIAVDATGNLFLCDDLNNRIRKVNSAGIISTIAGTGIPGSSGDGNAATSAAIFEPYGIAVDGAGNVYFADLANKIRKINTAGFINTIAGTGTAGYNGDVILATMAELNQPLGVAVDAGGNVYVADGYNHRVRKINTFGIINTYAGTGTEGYSGDNGLAINAELYGPVGVTVDIAGNLYIADYSNGHIRFIRSTEYINQYGRQLEDILLCPNPTSGRSRICMNSIYHEQVKFIISDLTGQKIIDSTTETNKFWSIELNLPDGIYILTAITSHGIESKKFSVKHTTSNIPAYLFYC